MSLNINLNKTLVCSPERTKNFIYVQVLRAFAALSVGLLHIVKELESSLSVDLKFLSKLPLERGVDLFFVISGFIMVYTCWDRFGLVGSPWLFLVRRFQRIVPLYWFYTSLVTAIILFQPHYLGATKNDIFHIISSYFFIPYSRGSDGWTMPILAQGWTLQFEMFFYLVFAFMMLFKRTLGITILVLVISLLVLSGYIFKPDSAILSTFTQPILIEFLLGCLIAVIYKKFKIQINKCNPCSFVLLALSIIIFYNTSLLGNHLPRFIASGLPSAFLVVVAVMAIPVAWEIYVPKFVMNMGDSSYSLYLTHVFVIRIVSLIVKRMDCARYLQNQITLTVFIFFLVLAIILVGWLGRIFIEIPLSNFTQTLKTFLKKPKTLDV